jgi:hypothetical protein
MVKPASCSMNETSSTIQCLVANFPAYGCQTEIELQSVKAPNHAMNSNVFIGNSSQVSLSTLPSFAHSQRQQSATSSFHKPAAIASWLYDNAQLSNFQTDENHSRYRSTVSICSLLRIGILPCVP